jgi:hypothetical protein
VGSILGSPLRADEAPSAAAGHGSSTPAAAEQSEATNEQPSAFRFTDTGNQTGQWKRHPTPNMLQLGNGKPESDADADRSGVDRAGTTPGFRFEGEAVSPRTVNHGPFLRPIPVPPAAPSATPLRFLDERPSLVRRRTQAGHLTLGNGADSAPAVTAGTTTNSDAGFSFTETKQPHLAHPLRPAASAEPIPARHPLLVVDPPAGGMQPTQAQRLTGEDAAPVASKHPLLGGRDASAVQDGELMTIRQRSDETPHDGSPPSRQAATPRRPVATPVATVGPARPSTGGTMAPPPSGATTTSPSPLERANPAGIVEVSSFGADPSHSTAQAADFNVTRGPQRMARNPSSAAADASGGDSDETAGGVPQWAQAQTQAIETVPAASDRFLSEDARRIDHSESEPAPAAHHEAWWAAGETRAASRHDSGGTQTAAATEYPSAAAGKAAEHLLLPVAVAGGTDAAARGTSGASTPRATPEEPAWLKPSPQSAPLPLSLEATYTGAVKPLGADTVPESGHAYTMGPERASRRLPATHGGSTTPSTSQPQPAGRHMSADWSAGGNISTSSLQLAALLNDLEPLVPGAAPLPGPDTATSPTAADFPSPSAETSSTSAPSGAAGAGESAEGVNVAEQTLGQRPEETNEPLQFLRRQTVLLEPGEHQIDVGISYLNDVSDFPVLLSDGVNLGVVRGQTRQRLLGVPLELRVGLAPYTQAFLNVPFGWSNSEVAFNGSEFTEDEGGIGDVSAGLTRQVVIGNQYYPDVLASLAFSAPTGDSSITTALGTPGSGLGQGFWTLTGGLSFIQTYDPLVIFYGLGYTFRFQNEFGDNIEIEPGDQVFYRFGAGFAVNPHVTLSAAFTGSVIGRDKVDGIEIGGSIREPMSIRLAATISRRKGSKTHGSFKLVEPYVNFGLNEDSIDTVIGISWTH